MGLLLVGAGAASSVLADQWREYFYCDALESDVLVVKGQKRKQKRSFNKGNDNVITDGSIIAVNEGQCMMIVEQGAIVEVSAQAGEYVFDSKTSPSIFTGDLKEGFAQSFDQFMKMVSMAGDTGTDQRVYFFNTKDIIGNKYGTANPIPFRVVDQNIGLDVDISLRCHGEYAYKIVDPILFYKNICGNVVDEYTRDQISSQLKSEMLTAMQPAFAKISDMGIRYSAIPAHTMELADALNEALSDKWGKRYGIEITTIGVNSINASEEDEKMIKNLQKNAVFKNPNMAAAQLVNAQAEAMQAAANNIGGAMMGFAGMNMVNQAGGVNAQELFNIGQQEAQMRQQISSPAMQADRWTCSCGARDNTGKFCCECGKERPGQKKFWICSCGAQNQGKFCSECGKAKPAGLPIYKCDKCGWEPADPSNPPKFCPECGDPFDDADKIN